MRFSKISTRINLTILPIVAAATLLLVVVSYQASNSRINTETEHRMFARLQTEAARITDLLNRNAAVANALVSYVQSATTEEILDAQHERFMRYIIRSNPYTIGGGIWFEPGKLRQDIRYFGPYYYRDGTEYRLTHMYDTKEYDYPSTEWYRNGKNSPGPIAWTEVYHDPVSNITMLTGAQPFFDKDGAFRGVCSADMDAADIRRIVLSIREGETGHGMLVGSNSQYLAIPERQRAAMLNLAEPVAPGMADFAAQLMKSDQGITVLDGGDYRRLVYFTTIPATGWKLAISISEEELQRPVRSLTLTMLGITLVALALMIMAVLFLSRHLHRVIHTVNNFARSAAAGNLDERISLNTGDEFADIAESLNVMIGNMQEMHKAKSNFVSRMSHEIRTPMNAIIGMAQLAKTAQNLVRRDKCLSQIEDSSKHLLGIINDILDYSKAEAAKLTLDETDFSLKQNLDFVMSMFGTTAAGKGVALLLEAATIRHDGITTDPLRLNQVLINLVSNALKFTEAGGSISLCVEETAYEEGSATYRFTVSDTGIGISPEQAEALFRPFAQGDKGIVKRYGGTGLGLAISQSIVQLMGGTITLTSTPGQGSAFSFEISVPATEAAAPAETTASACPAPNLADKRVLLVEDIEINRIIVREFLADTKVTIDEAENGSLALAAYNAHPPGYYDLIFMDMQMPVMDGYTAVREIRRSGRPDAAKVPILAMTANVMKEDVDYAFQCGINAYISKPVSVDEMYRKLGAYLCGARHNAARG